MASNTGTIDFHSHILPGVDDGPARMEESLKILEKGIADGIRTFILTPHLRRAEDWGKVSDIREVYARLRAECRSRGLDAELVLGAEIFITSSLADHLSEGIFFRLGASRYVLVELPFTQRPIYADEVFFSLLVRGIIPVIAHPERYSYLYGRSEILEQWVEKGVRLQLNTGSLTGRYGVRAKRMAKMLVRKKLAHFFGSDIHGINDYSPPFPETVAKAEKIASGGMLNFFRNMF